MQKIASSSTFGESLLGELRELRSREYDLKQRDSQKAQPKTDGPSFMDHIKKGIEETNQAQKVSEQKATDLVTGKSENIHDTMLEAAKAELSFNLMVQIRNKALEAYQEVMRMQV